MTRKPLDVFEELKKLDLPSGEYIVLGSGILGALGIRDINDVDLLVSPQLFEKLLTDGWMYAEVEIEGRTRKKAYRDHYEAYQDFWYGTERPDAKQLISDAVTVRGFSFLSLEKLMEIKTVMGREKDLQDVLLIQKYLMQRHG
ncbi:MAG: hypothetical protein WC866_05920 [Patescibacteria group bacterium]|jgi:hypothetical protein